MLGLENISSLTCVYLFNVVNESNIRFLAPSRRSVVRSTSLTNRNASQVKYGASSDIYYSSIFASGRVLTSMMLESILSSAYHQPSLMNIFNIFCGVRYKIDHEIDSLLEYKPSNLCYISVPSEMVGKSFGAIYQSLSDSIGIIPIGILREENNHSLGNKYPFVYTNPPSCMLLLASDLIYVLANPDQII
jgi:hypothetical protein